MGTTAPSVTPLGAPPAAGCGKQHWWREPDLVTLLERYGAIEHFLIQIDFVAQVWRLPDVEYAIPRSSKGQPGHTGFADIVSALNHEIWEIKPRGSEVAAAEEAKRYVTSAQAFCDPGWHLGRVYSTLTGDGVVFGTSGSGVTAELHAWQPLGFDGVVVYEWRVNGKPVYLPKTNPFLVKALRERVVKTYFPTSATQRPLPGSKNPQTDLPPIRWRPPVLQPGGSVVDAWSSNRGVLTEVLKSIRSVHPLIAQNTGVAMLVERDALAITLGQQLPAAQQALMRVPEGDPTVTLYREAVAVLTAAGCMHGAVAFAIGGVWLLAEAAVAGVAGIVVLAKEVAAAAVLEAATLRGAAAAFVSGLQANPLLLIPVIPGATMIAFIIPTAAQAAPTSPQAPSPAAPAAATRLESMRSSVPMFKLLGANDLSSARVGQSLQVNGTEWVVAAIAVAAPD